jgi:hypothetical protein
MELRFTPLRVAILMLLLLGFGLLGVFGFPPSSHSYLTRAWLFSVVLFGFGGVSATLVDHWVGNLDRSNLRGLYIVLGALCMCGALVYQHVLKSRMEIAGPRIAPAKEGGALVAAKSGFPSEWESL